MSDYVKFLRDTSPYINLHRGKTFVIAFSGGAVCHERFSHLIHDIALLHSLGIKLVLVHGARTQIEERLRQQAIAPRFCSQTRITDEATLACVKDAVGSTRIAIEALLSTDHVNSPMHRAGIRVAGGNLITARPLGVRDGVDFHHSGEVRRVDRKAIETMLEPGSVVLISPLGYSPTGEVFNLDWHDVATQVAIALKAEKLILLNREPGVMDGDGTLQEMIPLRDTQLWREQLGPESSLYQNLGVAAQVCQHGVARCHLIGYAENGALLKELFTRQGAGTLVLEESREVIRAATIADVGGLIELISPLEESGVLVKRSRELLENEISRFLVMVHPEGMLIGCGALYPFADQPAGELACLVTHPDYRNQGLATRMLARIEQEAQALYLEQLFVLTTQTAHWFREQGFEDASLDDLPRDKQALYNYQRSARIYIKPLTSSNKDTKQAGNQAGNHKNKNPA